MRGLVTSSLLHSPHGFAAPPPKLTIATAALATVNDNDLFIVKVKP